MRLWHTHVAHSLMLRLYSVILNEVLSKLVHTVDEPQNKLCHKHPSATVLKVCLDVKKSTRQRYLDLYYCLLEHTDPLNFCPFIGLNG